MATSLKTQSLPAFKKIALGISLFFFLCTFPYWFFGADSPLSIINILFNKIDRTELTYNYDLVVRMNWINFYLHVVLTSIGLLIYYNSRFQCWLGEMLSYRYLSGFFLSNNEHARKLVLAFKIVMGLLMVLLIYDIFTETIKGSPYVPRISFTFFILIFFISTTGWNVTYPDPLPIPNYSGSMDNRNKVMLAKLSDEQIAYVQNSHDKQQWNLKERREDVDLSFTEAYIINLNQLKHHLSGIKVIESAIGTIECKVELEPRFENIPPSLSFKQLQNLNSLSSKQQVESLVFLALDQSSIKKDIEEKFDSLNTYFLTHPRASVEEWNDKHQKIYREISPTRMDASISQSIQESVNHLVGGEGVFKVHTTISRDTATEYFKEKIAAHREQSVALGQQAWQQEKQILIASLAKRLEHPGLPMKNARELLGMIGELNSQAVNGSIINNVKERFEHLVKGELEMTDQPELIKAAREIAKIIVIARKQHYDKAETKELIAGSTSFFESQGISIESFFEKLFDKWELEREERTEEAYRQLVRDTLKQFLKPA